MFNIFFKYRLIGLSLIGWKVGTIQDEAHKPVGLKKDPIESHKLWTDGVVDNQLTQDIYIWILNSGHLLTPIKRQSSLFTLII